MLKFSSGIKGTALIATLVFASLLLLTFKETGIVQASTENFGYDENGGSSASLELAMRGSAWTVSSWGTADSIVAFLSDQNEVPKQAAIYRENDNTLLTNGTTEIKEDLVWPAQWLTFTFSTPPTLEAGVAYVLEVRAEDVVLLYYDAGDEDQGHYQDGGLGSFPSTATFIHDNNKYSVYCLYTPITPASQPVLYFPENSKTYYDNTPYFEWTIGENADDHRLLVDNDPDFSSPEENRIVPDNNYTIADENALLIDNYNWRVVAINELGENNSDNWVFTIPSTPRVTTNNATDIEDENATLNATIFYGAYDNVDIRFDYRSRKDTWTEPDNENWSISYYTDVPVDPATIWDWGNRTPVMYIAALDSSQADKDFVAGLGENGWQCDNDGDQAEINEAIENLQEEGGKIFLFAGNYYINDVIGFGVGREEPWGGDNNISLVGAGKDNTIINAHPDVGTLRAMIGIYQESHNILIENITLFGRGRAAIGEYLGIHLTTYVSNIVLQRLTAVGFTAIGIYLELSDTAENVWIMDTKVSDVGDGGIIAIRASHIYIDNNLVYNSLGSPSYGGGPGIGLYGLADSIVSNNTVENSGLRGISIGQYTSYYVENILIQANTVTRSALMMDMGATTSHWYEISVVGEEAKISRDVVIRGNDVKGLFGINVSGAENCILDNNDTYNTFIAITIEGTGHINENIMQTIENITTWEMIADENTYDVSIVTTMADVYAFRGKIRFYENEYENYGSVFAFSTPGATKPLLYSPDNNSENVMLKPSFEWTNGENADYHNLLVSTLENFMDEVLNMNFGVPENTYTPLYNLPSFTDLWWKVTAVIGDFENESDVWTFKTVPEWTLIETWTGMVDAFSTWELIDTWIGTIEAFATWELIMTWTGTVEVFVQWELVETWTGTIEAFTEWQVIEAWTGMVETYTEWELIETWTGTIETQAAWELIETWTGTIETQVTWELIETWTGGVLAYSEWSQIEIWTGNLSTQAAWNLMETWTGSIENPQAVQWRLIEEWIGTTKAFAQWELEETWIGVIEAFAQWELKETWTSTAEAPSLWTLLETWTGAVQAPSLWTLIEQWTGTIEAYAEWQLLETWTSSIQHPVGWNLIETWTGTIQSVGPWHLIEIWSGIVDAPGNAPPTKPTVVLTPSTIYVGTELWITASSYDNDPITYYFKFYNVSDAATRQDWSIDNSYSIQVSDAHDTMRGYAKASDSQENSAENSSDKGVSNTAPGAPSMTSALGMNEIDHTPMVTWNKGGDIDGDTVNTYVYVGGSPSPTTEEGHNTGTFLAIGSTVTLSDGQTYYTRFRGHDGSVYSSYTSDDEFRMNSAPTISNPRVEGDENPTAVEDRTPDFSWVYSDADGDTQSYWQIYVGTSVGVYDMWDSELVSGSGSTDSYRGIDLDNNFTYYWQVRTQDGSELSGWAIGIFTTSFSPTIPDPDDPTKRNLTVKVLDNNTGLPLVDVRVELYQIENVLLENGVTRWDGCVLFERMVGVYEIRLIKQGYKDGVTEIDLQASIRLNLRMTPEDTRSLPLQYIPVTLILSIFIATILHYRTKAGPISILLSLILPTLVFLGVWSVI